MQKGQSLTLRVEKFADKGKSLTRIEGRVVFIDGGVPGDLLQVGIVRTKSSYAEARIESVLEPSPLRTDPVCRYFGECGGCRWQHVDYAAQCEAKRQSVEDALRYHGGLDLPEVRPTVASDRIYGYRNKMEFSFGARRWLTAAETASGESFDKRFALGLHVPGRFEHVLDIEECHLPAPLGAQIVNGLRTLVRAEGWTPWNVRTHQGYLRHLVLRIPERVEEAMVNLVTAWRDEERIAKVADYLREHFPQITTFVNTINTGLAQTAFGEEMDVVFGPGVVHDRIGRFTFEIAANAFFQTNTAQAERLYEVTREFAALRPDDLVYDLYCGAGTIALYLSDSVKRVVGVELIQEAVDNAEANARANGVTNCQFVAGDLLRAFTPDFVRSHGRPDVLVVDPPRAGMHPKVVKRIGELRPERFVYVSCNPMTQARDLKELAEIFAVEAVQPVDLFPHTHHVESVVKLSLRR